MAAKRENMTFEQWWKMRIEKRMLIERLGVENIDTIKNLCGSTWFNGQFEELSSHLKEKYQNKY